MTQQSTTEDNDYQDLYEEYEDTRFKRLKSKVQSLLTSSSSPKGVDEEFVDSVEQDIEEQEEQEDEEQARKEEEEERQLEEQEQFEEQQRQESEAKPQPETHRKWGFLFSKRHQKQPETQSTPQDETEPVEKYTGNTSEDNNKPADQDAVDEKESIPQPRYNSKDTSDVFQDGHTSKQKSAEAQQPEQQPSFSSFTTRKNDTSAIQLEQHNAQLQALNEARKATNERFLRVSEEIGQLREGIMSREKEIKDLTMKVTRSVDLVERIQPEKVFEATRKQDAKNEQIMAKIEGNTSFANKILDEVKEIKKQMSVFKGVEQVIKLTDEAKESLTKVQKMESVSSEHADKVERFFVKIEQQYKEFEQFKQQRDDMLKLHKNIMSHIDEMKTQIADAVTHQDITHLNESLQESLHVTLETVNKLKQDFVRVEEQVQESQQAIDKEVNQRQHTYKSVKKLWDETDSLHKLLQRRKKDIKEHEEDFSKFSKRMKQEHKQFNQSLQRLEKHMSKEEDELNKTTPVIDAIRRAVNNDKEE